MKKLIKSSIFFVITVFSINTAFGFTGNISKDINTKTIKELGVESKKLKNEQKEILKKRIQLQKTLLESGFIKNNLNLKSKEYIKNIIEGYKLQRQKYENILNNKLKNFEVTKNIKIKLLNLKKELYSNLVPYVKEDKLKDYFNFVKKDLYTLKEYKNIKENSLKTNIILKEKLHNIKEKIVEQKKKTKEELKKFIIKKIDIKINIFKNNEKFKKLSLNKKNKIINYIINKINKKIKKMENTPLKTEIFEIKIAIYNIVKNKFIKLKEEL